MVGETYKFVIQHVLDDIEVVVGGLVEEKVDVNFRADRVFRKALGVLNALVLH